MTWNWTPLCQLAFDGLKRRFLEAPVLKLPEPHLPFEIECDASKVATGAVLRQKDTEGRWHPCAYLSQSFSETERNYQIYDRELLAIIRALRSWRHYLDGAAHPIVIKSDHRNLTYWKEARDLNRRQARWALELSLFDIQLVHVPGKSLIVADALSRRPDHDPGENDNKQITLLPTSWFVRMTSLPLEERLRLHMKNDKFARDTGQALQAQQEGFRTQDWQQYERLLLYQGRTYVPDDQDLRREITRMYHEPPSQGHPGIHGTYLAVSRDYWWPQMRRWITSYVKGCPECQAKKVNTHPVKPGLYPIPPTTTRPFGTITVDHLVDLPESNGFTSIQVVVDHDVTKAIVLTPCNKELTALETANLLHRDVFKRFGLPERIISD